VETGERVVTGDPAVHLIDHRFGTLEITSRQQVPRLHRPCHRQGEAAVAVDDLVSAVSGEATPRVFEQVQ